MAFSFTAAAPHSKSWVQSRNGSLIASSAALVKLNLPKICSSHPVLAAQQPAAVAQKVVNRRIWRLRAVSGAGGSSGGGSGSSGGGGSGGGSSSGGSGDGAGAHPMRLWTFLYAAVLAGGGVMAYIKKGSTKSLTSALGAALILSLSARAMLGPQVKGSLAVCLAIATLLSVVMSGRYSRTKKMMPAGITAGLSLAMSAAYLGFLFQ